MNQWTMPKPFPRLELPGRSVGLVFVAAVVALTVSTAQTASANHCDALRRSYNKRLQHMATRYHHDRRAMYDAYECHRDRLHESLRDARRNINCHPGARDRIDQLKRQLRVAHRNVHERMDSLECRYKQHRKAVKYERDESIRACRKGVCQRCCRASSPVEHVHQPQGYTGIPGRQPLDPHRHFADPLGPGFNENRPPQHHPIGNPPPPPARVDDFGATSPWQDDAYGARGPSTSDWVRLVSLLLRER